MQMWRVIAAGSAVITLAVIVAGRVALDAIAQPVDLVTLHVTRGMTARHVSEALQPSWPQWAHGLMFRWSPQLAAVQEGRYAWSPDTSYHQVLSKMVAGDAIPSRVTLIEGMTAQMMVERLAEHPDLRSDDTDLESWLQRWDSPFRHPEGAFLAETFFWHGSVSTEDILRRAHDALIELLAREWASASAWTKKTLRSPYEALILASIVEKETAIAAERPIIAGVFLARLNQGMRLQTDPTVIYGLGASFDGNLTRQNLREKTPYNTYRIDGLPPTPIALVGRDALRSVMQPTQTTALYFVARGDGSHAFAETLEEHNRNVRTYQLRSTP